VLALGPSTSTGRFAVCVATLGLLSAAAEKQPLLVVVDDAHWLDPSSAEALRFTARRLRAEGIALLIATRPAADESRLDAGIPTLDLAPLPFDSAKAVMARHSPRPLSTAEARRLYEFTAGNPLALTETVAWFAVDADGVAAPDPVPDVPPVAATLQRAYRRRVAALPEVTQRALVVAAAEPSNALAPITMALDHLEL